MKLPVALLATLTTTVHATDYFFRFIGGTPILTDQRLRLNDSAPHNSPGVTLPPYSPSDHFARIFINDTSAQNQLFVVPTNPHPPPVPGYYGLSGAENVDSAFRLKLSYRPQDEGEAGVVWKADRWRLKRTGTRCGPGGRVLLRYGTEGEGDAEGWRWIAVREPTPRGVERWVPWWVRPTAKNAGVISGWDYEVVDVELVVAGGPVNSGAPGGVEE